MIDRSAGAAGPAPHPALPRREFLRRGGRAGLSVAALSLLAACGIQRDDEGEGAAAPKLPPLAHELVIAQWPLYIDKKKGESPTLQMFERTSGIEVTYKEVINDNQQFFAKLSEPLSQERSTGWDLIALSDWVVTKMARLGWLMELDYSLLPTVDREIGAEFQDPPYDRGNAHSVPWQGGITGIAYNPRLAKRELSRFSDLWDESLAGHVGMLTEMVDTMNLTLLSLDIDPQTATVEDAEQAQERLIEQREAGIVRGFYGNDYLDGLARGDLWATMAWSGDIFQLQLSDPDMRFVVPEEGGILWATGLEIPAGAEHPRDAHAFMDFVYQPEIAAQIAEWVGYITPVPAAQEIILDHARDSQGAGREYLETLANSPLVFPTDDMKANLHSYKVLSADEEEAWNDLFQEVVQG
jgi:spermidine/putrescine transport system substrate-binding protein